MTNQQRNVINKDLIVNRIIEKTLDESGSKLVKRIIRQVKNSRKKPKTYLNIDEKQLNHLLFELIKKWQKSQISSSVDKFLAVIKDS
jgi:hypothetical protein